MLLKNSINVIIGLWQDLHRSLLWGLISTGWSYKEFYTVASLVIQLGGGGGGVDSSMAHITANTYSARLTCVPLILYNVCL